MSTPDPEGIGLAAKVIGAIMAVGTPIAWLWAKLDKKADKHTVNTQFQAVNNELHILRSTQGKIFDQVRENEQRAQDRHDKLLEKLSGRP